MKTAAVIAEYNPFHNGHLYHLNQIREQTGADVILVLMSGDFTQRGIPAIYDKYTRTEMALLNGANLVMELPVYYACGSAEYFALGSIQLLNQLNTIDYLCFGCECDNLPLLKDIASTLVSESDTYKQVLREQLKNGCSYPDARNTALLSTLTYVDSEALSAILHEPNNILAIEYLKALIKTNSPIQPVAIRRQGAAYISTDIKEHHASAMAIRTALSSAPENLTAISHSVPASVFALLQDHYAQRGPVFQDDFSSMLHYKLLSEADSGFEDYIDCNEDISNKILNALPDYTDFTSFCQLLKTKNITHTRLNRILFHILLSMRKEDLERLSELNHTLYGRILGFIRYENTNTFLSSLKKNSSLPIITNISQAKNQLAPDLYWYFSKELSATSIYRCALFEKYKKKLPQEARQPFLVL